MNKNNRYSEPSLCERVARKSFSFASFIAFFALALFASCSQTTGVESEYSDWQSRNDTYFQGIYTSAQQKISSGDTNWKVYDNWCLETAAATKPGDHIVVQVLQQGTGSGCPMYSDSVKVNYRGYLMPSKSFANGYIFDQTYIGDLNLATANPAVLKVSSLVDGFTTALMNMHIGDHWRVYIPYGLGYGSSTSNTSIPAYSMLIFDIYLSAYYRAGTPTNSTRSGKTNSAEVKGMWITQ